ncbi:MAG TPA: poly-gamma-glutamate system protein [Ignavibacteriaceae bacterium]
MLHLKIKYEFKLVLVFSFALLLLYAVDKYFTKIEIRKDCAQMSEAISLTERWFNDVGQMKKEKKISNDIRSDTKYNFLIGDEYTNITTTFGSLEAKELSANPEFAALLIKYLTNSNIDSTKTVGIILSGSFPSLSISCLAAIQTLNSKAIIFSSLGASMFGANQPGATWLDIENYLIKSSNLKYKSSLVTVGAEDDNGGGLSDDGFQILKTTASNYNVSLYYPPSLKESIEKKVEILLGGEIDILINIGGNQTSLGSCAHSSNIPNGFHREYKSCNHENRGIIARLSEREIPFINLLNIKSLAIENQISLDPTVVSGGLIFSNRKTEKIPIALSIIASFGLILLIRKKKNYE